MTSLSIDQARANVANEIAINVLTDSQDIDNQSKIKEIARTFISDTVTVPTKELQAYACLASLGDDVYHEPSTHALENHIAKITGKEAAVFLSSGSMSNQIAIRTHLLQPPHSVLCDVRSHLYKYEAGGIGFLSQAASTTLLPTNGLYLTAAEIEKELILDDDVHFANTKVISLENTLNGIIFPQDEILKIAHLAQSKGQKLHLDGARIWHVAAETGMPLSELCSPFDSVSLCFSKGLGAPVGSCLAGSHAFVKKARAFRKLFGGAMRQTGFLAAAAAYTLTHNFPLLPRVHLLAKRLRDGLERIGVKIIAPVDTCMVFYDPAPVGLEYGDILAKAAGLPDPIYLGGSRLVVHIQTSEKAVEDLLSLIGEMAKEKSLSGFVPSADAQSKGVSEKSIYVRPKKPEINGTGDIHN